MHLAMGPTVCMYFLFYCEEYNYRDESSASEEGETDCQKGKKRQKENSSIKL